VERADAIVIGAGHNGLVAANLLADAGWTVEVLEATPQPGGAVRSGYVTAPGYLSDLFSSFYPLGFASPVMRALQLQDQGLRWTHAPDVLTHLLPDGRSATVNRDLDATMASMEHFAVGDGERWRQAYEEWRDVSPHLLDALFTPFPPVRAGLELARRLRVSGGLRMARRLILSVRELGSELFRGEGAQLAFAGCALHTDLAPESAGGGVYGWLLAMLGQEFGWPVPVGGAQQITAALVARLEQRGGRITYDTPVTRVLVAQGRAMGVRTADGRNWRARRAVLADVPAPALYLDLVGARRLPPRLVEDLEHFRWDGATVKIDWAVAGKIPWKNPAAAAQQLFLRPVPGLGRADTPIERLYLASASAHPGGGVHGAPGANAARAALARERALTGGLYRAAINAAHRAIYHDGAP
jgi:phytoene dehydrogenase-like protein